MSRSLKKPFHSLTRKGLKEGKQKKWKKNSNKIVRRQKIESRLPSFYKKLTEILNSPKEIKVYNPNDPKSYRK